MVTLDCVLGPQFPWILASKIMMLATISVWSDHVNVTTPRILLFLAFLVSFVFWVPWYLKGGLAVQGMS